MQKHLHKTFVRQLDLADCGVAALLGIIRFYGGDEHLERLRERSGTSRQGTTLLGLYQAAQHLGFTVNAWQADGIENLRTVTFPCILHVLKDGRLSHYIVCYGYEENNVLVGDPASGITTITGEELESLWQSKTLLTLTPNADFIRTETLVQEKRRWMRELIEQDFTVLFIAFALGVIISILSLSTAIFSQKLVDKILPDHDSMRLVTGLTLLGVLLAARSGLNFLRGQFLIRQSRDFNNRIITRFYGVLLRLPQAFFDNRKTGDLIARMNDAQRLQQALTYIASDVMIDALLFIVSSVFIVLYSLPIGVFVLCSISVYFVLAYRFHKPIAEGQHSVMAAYSLNESNYIDTIQGIATIKATGKEEHFSAITRSIYGLVQEKAYLLGSIGRRFNLAAEVASVVILVGVLSWAALLVLQGTLLVGALVAIVQMASQLNSVSLRLAVTNIRLQEARIAFERMYAFASIKPEFTDETERATVPIERFEALLLQQVTFRFAGRPALLHDGTLEVRRGELVALLGESGCGKTTIMQMLQRFYEPESGSILVTDQTTSIVALRDISVRSWRNIIGVVPQHIKIFNGTVLDNICLGHPAEEAERVVNFCQEYGFEKYIAALPQGYTTLVGEEGVNLSGGQRQIIALARALYRKPQLLLLDEATSAMDKKTEADILQLLHRLKNELAILMVTHRTQNIQIAGYGCADRAYIMEEGRITLAAVAATHTTMNPIALKERQALV